MHSSTRRLGSEGPTRCSSAAARTRLSATAAETISGPMPRTSPSVTASRGRWLTIGSRSARGRGGGDGQRRQRDRLGPHRDVRLLLERIEVAAHAARFGETRADLLLQLGERHVAARLHRVDLRDDDLHWNVRVAGYIEHDDVLRLL